MFPENLIGKGGSSRVYKGCLPGGEQLAVKVLNPSEEMLKHFVSEIEIITSLHHKNLISVVGFCYEEDRLLLVYNLLSRGSLEENLHGMLLYPAWSVLRTQEYISSNHHILYQVHGNLGVHLLGSKDIKLLWGLPRHWSICIMPLNPLFIEM